MDNPTIIQTISTIAIAIITGIFGIIIARIQSSSSKPSKTTPTIILPDGVALKSPKKSSLHWFIVFTILGGIIGYMFVREISSLNPAPTPIATLLYPTQTPPTTSLLLDIVLVFDSSGSTNYFYRINDPNDILLVAQSITNEAENANIDNRVAIVLFGESAIVRQPLSNDFSSTRQQIANSINNYELGNTSILVGLQEAYNLLNNVKRSNSSRVIILFTDGNNYLPNENEISALDKASAELATTIKGDGIQIVCVQIKEEPIDNQLLPEIASDGYLLELSSLKTKSLKSLVESLSVVK